MVWFVCGCDAPPVPEDAPTDTASGALFDERSKELGLDFQHVNGATGELYFPEIMGSGAALFDFDNDGDLDAYLVQGGFLDRSTEDAPGGLSNRLYRNDLSRASDGGSFSSFVDVTEAAGVGDMSYGMGTAVGDFDNDGFLDLFVTNFGPNRLYRNEGNGTFTEVGNGAGVDDARWSTSASFFDFDGDGFLDLFVVNYVDFKTSDNKLCRPGGVRDYCHPSNFDPETDILYRNQGDGTFVDVTGAAGIAEAYGSGLGVMVLDFDQDGWLDVYVANDGNENQLWMNRGDGRFDDVALFSGVALNVDGAAEAGMGVTVDDYDHDGDPDIFVTHLRAETHTLYQNQDGGFFEDVTFALGLGYPSLSSTGFGVHWFDFDNDGFSDLFCANGAVSLDRESTAGAGAYAEPNHLYRNVAGESFEQVPLDSSSATLLQEVSRGAAFGDVDNDGDIDVLVSNNGGPARLLLNEVGAERHWISLKLKRALGEPFGFGARVTLVRHDGIRASKRVHTDGSYCSANDLRVHFGLGTEASIRGVEVSWPRGDIEFFDSVHADRVNELVEGDGAPP